MIGAGAAGLKGALQKLQEDGYSPQESLIYGIALVVIFFVSLYVIWKVSHIKMLRSYIYESPTLKFYLTTGLIAFVGAKLEQYNRVTGIGLDLLGLIVGLASLAIVLRLFKYFFSQN